MATIRIPGFRSFGTGGRTGPGRNRPQATTARKGSNNVDRPDKDYLISQANKILKTNPVKVAPLKRVNDWRKEYDRLKEEVENDLKEE